LYKFRPKTLFIGKKMVYLPTCQSTNDEATLLLQQKQAPDGTVVITNQQLAGRGQRGNQWHTQPGQNLTFSIVFEPHFLTITEQFQLNIAISLGVWAALSELLPAAGLKIKWPNDIYYNNQKLGGILIENNLQGVRIESATVGIGLNINQLEFENLRATSLQKITQRSYDLVEVLDNLLLKIEENYLLLRTGHHNPLKMRYLQNLYRYQEIHHFEKDGVAFEGMIVGIGAYGKLAVQIENTLQYFDLKEISYLIE
jgi:BirA family transcriptional regulator, biotin operon repressor / biotin---[acetyl-CoA-carboxylase] ligase